MRLQPEAPVLAFARLTDRLVTLFLLALSRLMHMEDRRIHYGAGRDPDSFRGQMFVHPAQHRTTQFTLFEQMTKPADGFLIRQSRTAKVHAGDLAKHRRLVKRLLHARIG